MSLHEMANYLASRGRNGDEELVHMTKGEVAGLQALAEQAGGSLTINPDTGKPEAFFLAALLPTILGGAGAAMGMTAAQAALLGAGAGMLSNKENPMMGALMGGLGGFGGAGLASGLGAGTAGAAGAAGATGATAVPGAVSTGTGALSVSPTALASTPAGSIIPTQIAEPGLRAVTTTPFSGASGMATEGLRAGTDVIGSGIGSSIGVGSTAPASTAAAMSGKDLLTYGSAALAPGMLYQPKRPGIEEEDTVLPRYDYTAGLTGDYYGMGGDNSTRERNYFTQPTFTRRAAQGGIMQLAEGGDTDPKDPAQGMTGASAEAMRYLMGQTNTSPATQAQQNAIKAAEAARAAPQGFLVADKVAKFDPKAAMLPGLFGVGRKPQPGEFFSGSESGRDGYGGWGATPIGMMGELLDGKKDEMPRYSYDPLTQRYTKLAEGGIAELAKGGMKSGGFVIPADVVSMVGEGNTEAGYKDLARALPGATPIRGKDGGQADTVKTSIEGKQPARVAHGEMYVPPAAVKRAGGAKKLYAMMDKVRKQAKGDTKQIKPVDLRKALA